MNYTLDKTILKLENVSLKLGDKQILKNLNIELKDIIRPNCITGQIVGLLAPSGYGKSKTLEVMSGIITPTTGKVLIGTELKPIQIGEVGVVQQNYPLFNHRTIFSNLDVAAARTMKNKEERHKRINELLEKFQLTKHSDFYPAELSGGQRQRIAIAQQLLCSNHFLLLDEPFSGLDINMIKEVSRFIVEIANMDELNTIIIVSHDVISTAAIADILWIMGKDKDEKGNDIDGAYIKYIIDLMERDLAWHEDIETMPKFHELLNQIREIFKTL